MKMLAADFVRAAYRKLKSGEGKAKLEYAKNCMYASLAVHGFEVSDDMKIEIDGILHTALQEFETEISMIDH